MTLIKQVTVNAKNDAGQEEVIIELANGRVIQVSPTFNSINVWEPGAWHADPRPYCVVGQFRAMGVEMGGSEG